MITKRLIQLLVTLVLVAALVMIGLILFVDPNRYKAVIVTHVEQQLQRPFAINGDISWRFWPRLGLSLEGVQLGQADAFKSYQNNIFAEVGQASIYVRIAPLLSKQIDVDKLSIQDAKFYLLQQADGTTNWADLQKSKSTETTTDTASGSTFKVEISDIAIENTEIHWDDQKKKQKIDFLIQSLATSLQSAQTNPLDAKFTVNLHPQNIQLTMATQSDYEFNREQKHYAANHGKLTMTVQGLQGFNNAQEVNVHFDKLARDFTADTLTIDNLKADVFGGQLYVNAKGETINDNPSFSGKMSAAHLNPKQIAEALGQPLETTDSHALQQLNVEATFKNTNDGFSMQPFTAQLDQTKINGDFTFSKNNNIQFNLAVDKINLDSYLSKKTTTGSKKSANKNNKTQGYHAKGDVSIGTLVVSGLTLTDTKAHLDATQNIIKLSPLKTHLYSGTLETTTTVDVSKSVPFWNINAKLSNIDIAALSSQQGKSPKFTGRLNLNADITTSGKDNASMLNALNGKTAITVDNGVLQGTDFGYWLSVGETMLLSAKNLTTVAVTAADAAVGKNNTHQTAFKNMSGSFSINKGIAYSEDLKVYNDSFYATGKGDINLPAQTLNYTVQVGKTQNASVQIPLKVNGSLKNPNVSIDPAAIQTLLLHGIGSTLITTAPLVAGPAGIAAGVGAAIVEGITEHNNTSSNTSDNTNSNNSQSSQDNQKSSSHPETIIKDTLKGILGQ